ncbi:MAG TPA: hypothetical protein VMB85_20415 [Bryobacteraceae bacterium]|nr:hypothetical protein [Bryobacteraceae bacterium]
MRVVAFLTVVALAGCASKSPPGVKVDASLEKLVPRDTILLAGAQWDSLLKTPLYQENFANRQIPQIDEFAKRTGVDPRKDLSELLYASNGRGGVLLGRGKFAIQGVPRSAYKGFNFYGDDRNAVVLFSPAAAAAGDVDALHSLIDQRGKSSGPSAALAAQMKEIPAAAQFWAAYSGGSIHLPFDDASPLANLNKLIASVQTGTVYFDLREGLNGLARADCSSDQDAEQVAGAVRALIGIGRLSVPKNHPELAQVYDTLRVTQEARRVRLYVAVPQTMVDQFLGMWLRR